MFVLLPLIVGLVPAPQTSADQAQRTARLVPEIDDLLLHPTVKTSAEYDPASDSWRVVLVEEASQTEVAELRVVDDTREVEGVRVHPVARTLTYPTSSADQAIKLAAADPEVREEFLRHGPHTSEAEWKDGEWVVRFKVVEDGEYSKVIAEVGLDDETWEQNYVLTGVEVGWPMARGDEEAYGKQANYWYVWGPMALVFALAFWRTDKLYSLRNLDVLALLGFLVSHAFFRAGDSYWATLLWYPPLVYLLIRTLLMGFGKGERVEGTSNFSTPALLGLGVAASVLVLALNLYSGVLDVGYAGIVGAERILDGVMPYGSMPDDVGDGDTYGPLNYLLYVPFVLIFGLSGESGYLPAAHALTAVAFLVGALAMLAAGRRYAGARGAATLFFAWSVFPYTLFSTNNNSNDVLVAAALAVGLAVATSPVGRGATVAAGFAIKLFPLILAPLWMLRDGIRRRSSIIEFVLGGLGVALLTFWVLALDGDPVGGARLFYENTLAFQGERETPWSIFSQVPQLAFLQRPLAACALVLALAVAVVPQKRTVRRLAAFSAALVLALQLTFNYWFYTYVTWFEPFVFLALLLATDEKTPLDGQSSNRRPAGGVSWSPLGPLSRHLRSKITSVAKRMR